MPPLPRPFPLPPDPTLPPFHSGPLVVIAGGARVPQDGVTPWDMVLRVWYSLGGIVVSEGNIKRKIEKGLSKDNCWKRGANGYFRWSRDILWSGMWMGRERELVLPCKKIWWIKKTNKRTRKKRVTVNERLESWTVSAPARYSENKATTPKGQSSSSTSPTQTRRYAVDETLLPC